METISQKTVSIEFEGKKYVLEDNIALGSFLANLGIPTEKDVVLRSTKDGFILTVK